MSRKVKPYDLRNPADAARLRRRLKRFLKTSEEGSVDIDKVIRLLRGRAEATITKTRKGVSLLSTADPVEGELTNVTLALGRGLR